ncbi:hypothetical protein [Jannaschia donghaensis]|uniref:Uncharacterized protein n=1 Tax=Jannaschia donghaensis TaxID=420998 RepID=A0A0M6YFM4_9RHOB|nr:hypothetical protein [Jannaschia donghaensis]CTQ48750.1 hypothetical protein JDO7802_00755 [Jannaschia donghaensis]
MSVSPDIGTAAGAAQRRALRRARIADALRLLPFLGLLLFVLPDLVLSGGPATTGATAPWLIYLFAAWILLVLLSAWLGHLHARAERDAVDPQGR